VSFDDPNLLGYGGLVPVVRLAERCGLPRLAGQILRIVGAANSGGANPAAKLVSLVAGGWIAPRLSRNTSARWVYALSLAVLPLVCWAARYPDFFSEG
jgi:hypothetical protein